MSFNLTIPAQSVTIPAQSVSVSAAQIVYQNSWLGQTSPFTWTNIYNIPTTGQYRVSVGLYASTTSSSHVQVTAFVGLPISGLSAGQLQTASIGLNVQNGLPATSGSCVSFEGFSGLDVPLEVTQSGAGSISYDLYVTIEQLQ